MPYFSVTRTPVFLSWHSFTRENDQRVMYNCRSHTMFEVLNVNSTIRRMSILYYFETQFVALSWIGRVNGGSGLVRNLTVRIGSHQKSLSWGSGGLWLGATKMNFSLEMACFGEFRVVLWQNWGTVYISEFRGTSTPVHRHLLPCKVSMCRMTV